MSDLGGEGSEGERRAEKKKLVKRRKTGDRGPKLSVLNVNGTNVECQLETGKQKTVTFKFDCEDLVPAEIAKNLVSGNFLSDQHSEIFIEMVEDIMQQVKERPGMMPLVRHPVDKVLSGLETGSELSSKVK